MRCFCQFLHGNTVRSKRIEMRHTLLQHCPDMAFRWRNRLPGYVEDHIVFCAAFAQLYRVDVCLIGLDQILTQPGARYTLCLRHTNCHFELIQQNMERPQGQLFQLRHCTEGEARVVANFKPVGNHHLYQVRLIPPADKQQYVVFPSHGYKLEIPEGLFLYVFVDGEPVTCTSWDADVNPYFFVPLGGKWVEISILMAESRTRAQQYLCMELSWKDAIMLDTLDGPLAGPK